MPVTLFCPVCNVKVDVPDRLAGKSAPCPVCRTLIDIPLQDRAPAAHLLRRAASAAPWIVAGLVLAVLAWESVHLAELTDANRSLREQIGVLQGQIGALSERAQAPPVAPPAPAAPPPVEPAAPLGPDERAELQRRIAALNEALSASHLRARELEGELARVRGESAARVSEETAADEDIETRVNVKADATGPRIKFAFEGRATNTGKRPAPVVQIALTVTQFQGLNPLTNDVVAFVPHAAAQTERLRNLGPGETRSFWMELAPAEPALLRRDVTWEPQYSVAARVTRE